MGLYFWNSIVVSGLGTLIALLVGIPAGYGIARAQAHKLDGADPDRAHDARRCRT